MAGENRRRTVAPVSSLTSGNGRRSEADSGHAVRSAVRGLLRTLRSAPVMWTQPQTWRATAQLALWCVMSGLSALVTIVGWPVALVAERAGRREPPVRATVTHLLAEAVRLDLGRIERFSGIRIQPLALAGAAPGTSWRERGRALEQAAARRLTAYTLVDGVAAAALTAAAVGWWWATIACFVDFFHTRPYDSYSSIDLFGLSIGPSKFLGTHTIGQLVVGLVGVAMWPAAVRVIPVLDAALAGRLLGPGTQELAQEVDRLADARVQTAAAAESERRRIERDLHDGFQPQLVNLALNLGLARSRLASDPEAARELLDRAHDDAKRATEDLRSLVRGIHPSVLDERGLDAAFSALAAASSVRVQIDVHLDRRPPREAEGIAYFVVAEAITNINKHAEAARATITVTEIDGALRVLVQDDGRGGAAPEPGGGLSGLAARIAGINGTFSVTSPEGGPTWIEARIPCEW
jgi:signal transduction histidine kinase